MFLMGCRGDGQGGVRQGVPVFAEETDLHRAGEREPGEVNGCSVEIKMFRDLSGQG